MKKLISKHGKKLIAMVFALTMMLSTAATAYASWYGFDSKFVIYGRTETTIYDAEYDGNNVGADIWLGHDIYVPADLQYDFIIQKKEWWGWKDVAMEKGDALNAFPYFIMADMLYKKSRYITKVHLLRFSK